VAGNLKGQRKASLRLISMGEHWIVDLTQNRVDGGEAGEPGNWATMRSSW
jgi:hypothetical protein